MWGLVLTSLLDLHPTCKGQQDNAQRSPFCNAWSEFRTCSHHIPGLSTVMGHFGLSNEGPLLLIIRTTRGATRHWYRLLAQSTVRRDIIRILSSRLADWHVCLTEAHWHQWLASPLRQTGRTHGPTHQWSQTIRSYCGRDTSTWAVRHENHEYAMANGRRPKLSTSSFW